MGDGAYAYARGLVGLPDVTMAEREMVPHQLASLEAPDRFGPAEIDTLLNELGDAATTIS